MYHVSTRPDTLLPSVHSKRYSCPTPFNLLASFRRRNPHDPGKGTGMMVERQITNQPISLQRITSPHITSALLESGTNSRPPVWSQDNQYASQERDRIPLCYTHNHAMQLHMRATSDATLYEHTCNQPSGCVRSTNGESFLSSKICSPNHDQH
jgi:hypothetical protein